MGENDESRARDAERRRAEIDESIATLDPVWIERFHTDVDDDTRFERAMLIRAWAIGMGVLFLILFRRLLA